MTTGKARGHAASKIGRRDWLKAAAIVPAAGVLRPVVASVDTAAPEPPGSTVTISTDTKAIVETTSGRVRGFIRNGIFTWKGLPYAATTEAAGRFMPPSKPQAWAGIRSTMYYGPTCPQVPRPGWLIDENAFLFQWDDGQPGEDCLRVNVWSPGVGGGSRRPVLFWIHGGGFTAGSGQEQPAYHGENLARRGDVVVVSVNHRLGALGYLHLADFGERYASSGNAGMLDLVQSLEWVRDNIANFGGDPGNVTIFGQSGGGAKVSTLMAMPSAKGLFHKAVVQSGSGLRMVAVDDAAKLASLVVEELQISRAQIDRLHTIPAQQLIAAQMAAEKKMPAASPTRNPAANRGGWGPVVDGRILPSHPFDPAAPAQSAAIPMLIGTVLNETSPSQNDPKPELMTEAEMRADVARRFGGRSEPIIAEARKLHPSAKPIELLSIIQRPRSAAILQATRKAAQGASPAYMYLFAWKTPVLDGRPRAFHCSEIPFVFDNTDVSAFATGGGLEPRALAARVSDAWIAFARTGNPNHPGLPSWPAFDPSTGALMVFDTTCRVANDPDRQLRRLVEET
jgi:para-nitrobenzyl esterase